MIVKYNWKVEHCAKKNLNIRMETESVTTGSTGSENHTYTVASAPTVTGSVCMRIFRLFVDNVISFASVTIPQIDKFPRYTSKKILNLCRSSFERCWPPGRGGGGQHGPVLCTTVWPVLQVINHPVICIQYVYTAI